VNIEGDLLISILKLTRDGPVSQEVINSEQRLPASLVGELLRKLQSDGLIYLRGSMVEVSSVQRLRLAVRALESGGDLERVSGFLKWKEFEGMAEVALESNGYIVVKNLHFKHGGRRWEMDIIGWKSPIVICMDCKHWHHGLEKSAAEKIVEQQTERTRALVMSLPNPSLKIEFLSYGILKFVPAVLSLTFGKFKFYERVPIVPVLQLQDFLNQLPASADSLLCFTANGLKEYGRNSLRRCRSV
jgi:Holliday junction resolvase-like predicted endonuclease